MQIIAEQYPKSLLILDDVWSAQVARAFDIHCPTLITSRNAKVVSGFTAPKRISVADGESHDKHISFCSVKDTDNHFDNI